MEDNSILVDYKNGNEGKDTKEILSNLLKKMLDHKLNKLEKKHVGESNSLKIMSKISQNIIISLEHYSHRVRKEIYKLRHKNDESRPKKREHENNKKYYDSNKSMYKEDKNNDNNIESLINKDNKDIKFFLENSNRSKSKRPSKSIDPKKDKSFFSEIIGKEKTKKEKMDVFSRLTSKSIGNFKKFKLTINTPSNNSHIFSSKSKGKNLNRSSKNLHNILNKKNEGDKNNGHSPSGGKGGLYTEGKKLDNSKISTKLVSTPRLKQKQLKKVVQISLENTNNNTIGVESAKIVGKIKKTSSKGKLTHRLSKTMAGLKKEEKKNIDNNKIFDKKDKDNNISSENNNENKVEELKITNNILPKTNNTNELFQHSTKKSLLDEDIIKNVNKDELLVSVIKDDDNIAEISGLNLEGLELKESINLNLNLDNNAITKKPSVEFNNSVNSVNNNNNNKNNQSINNIKTITAVNQNNQSNSNLSNNLNPNNNNDNNNNNASKSDNNINNIIITNPKNNPVNFLDNNDEINFTLVEDSHVDENDNDLNKTIDLNISGLSDQLSLGEKFEAHLDEISRYLDMKDLCNLMLVNKECFTTIMNVLISKTEITIDILEEEINKLKETNKDIDFNKVNISPFKFSSNSSRAVSLLNNTSDCNLIKFNIGQSINNEIFRVFGIFFIAAGKKKEYLRLSNEEEKINYISKYFKKDIENMSLGSLIEKEINGKIFDDNIISSIYKYSYKYIPIISPNRFQKTNKDVAIFVFVVKNILEHIGALDQQNIKPDKEYILYNARLKNNKLILDELNSFFDKIN